MDSTLLRELADAYTAMPHEPSAPRVVECYAALTRELWAQFNALPLRVTFSDTDPYPDSRAMFRDCNTGHLAVYRYADIPASHPLAARAPNGETFNSVFRAVHDGLAHYPARYSFSTRGELFAFQAHARTLSESATLALATETLGQLAHYARYKTFAPQKAGLLPSALIHDAMELI